MEPCSDARITTHGLGPGNANILVRVAAEFGARRLSLCGSVARGEDCEGSDLDFYIWEFEAGDDGRDRANTLVAAIRELSPYPVDVRGHDLPGWPLDQSFEETMHRDALDLLTLVA